ncbi:hypothetical protein NYF14_12445 [Sphingobium sp. 10 DY56-G10]|jgi:hypothetical protein|nr:MULTISPECIES: hypothetical protein [Sphingomonadaceae]EAT06900.1 hypothetical protein SKA58_11058 [Sphingomonas sp. SKA58]
MQQDDDEDIGGFLSAIQARSGVIIATVGLIAWVALLWFMFADVL